VIPAPDRLPPDVAEDPRVSLALMLAEDAGRRAVAGQWETAVRWKGPDDRVTEMDLRMQAEIVSGIRSRFPADAIVAEEDEPRGAADREFTWIVDPLDGTNNYALGIPCFAVSLGIFRHGEPYAGVIHDPNTGFRCCGLRGHGAFSSGRRLELTPRALGSASNVCVRIPLEPDPEPLVSQWLREHKLRSFGSVALHLAFAALGAIDLVLDHKAALWDLAAGATILLEAGGRITSPTGDPLFPFDVGSYRGAAVPFLAGNPLAHAAAARSYRALVEPVRTREW
jgi:myo-inositol-1(or 4)-monophosphatase